jgi:anaerobic dimethyl sulfoxide reductase subunit B (iron-sulfur subunit)
MAKQYGFYIDSAKCTGCKTCQLACKDYKDLQVDVNFRRVYEYAGGSWQAEGGTWRNNVFAYYLSIACNHCADPACTKVCPSGAMHSAARTAWSRSTRRSVSAASPARWPAPTARRNTMRARAHDQVRRVLRAGIPGCLNPVCVDSCPLRALEFGPIDELRAKHGALAAVAPLPDAKYTVPSIVIKPNPKARPTGDKTGFLANPKEVSHGVE